MLEGEDKRESRRGKDVNEMKTVAETTGD